jgi:hypothetical protein
MPYYEARTILNNAYGDIEVKIANGEFTKNGWQSSKKLFHDVDFGVDLTKYNFSQQEATNINTIGLINYIAQGGQMPSTDLVPTYINSIKMFYEDYLT